MEFTGYSRVFSTENAQQYDTIGAFWDEMASRFGRGNLRGLGFNWTDGAIEYVIGLKDGCISPGLPLAGAVYKSIVLPDEGWLEYAGRTEALDQLYDEIYKEGPLSYEIETFGEDGACQVLIKR